MPVPVAACNSKKPSFKYLLKWIAHTTLCTTVSVKYLKRTYLLTLLQDKKKAIFLYCTVCWDFPVLSSQFKLNNTDRYFNMFPVILTKFPEM